MRKYLTLGIVAVILGALALLIGYAGTLLPAPSGPLNIIVISIDSLRLDHMSLYGYARQTTPHIDAWAKNAIVFDNYYATSFLTPISEMSVETGDYPFTNGVVNFAAPLKPGVKTLAELLAGAGYETAAFLSSPEFSSYPSLQSAVSRGFDVFAPATDKGDKFHGRGIDAPGKAVDWLTSGRTTDKPFFIWLAIGTAHWPYGEDEPNHFSDPSYKGAITSASFAGWPLFGFIYNGVRYSAGGEAVGAVGQADIGYIKDRYDDGLVKTDRMLQSLFGFLSRTGLDKRTIVVLESEHGESLGERGYIAHYDILDEEVHVPLVVFAPGVVPRRVSELASGVDVLPTILSLAKLPAIDADGVSLVPAIASSTPAREAAFMARVPLWEGVVGSPVVAEQTEGLPTGEVLRQYDTAIRDTHYKLIHRLARDYLLNGSWWAKLTGKPTPYPEYELYDIGADPGELHDLYSVKAADPAVVALKAKLSSWEGEMQKRFPKVTAPSTLQPYF